MRPMAKQARKELQERLFELTKACPVDQCNPEDCPLFSLRELKPSQRKQWFNALSEDDLVYLVSYHYVCVSTRLESPRAAGSTG